MITLLVLVGGAYALKVVDDAIDKEADKATLAQQQARQAEIQAEIDAARAQNAEAAERELRNASAAKDDYTKSQLARAEQKWRMQRAATAFTDETRERLGLTTSDIDRVNSEVQGLVLDELIETGQQALDEKSARECEEVLQGRWNADKRSCDTGKGFPVSVAVAALLFAGVGITIVRRRQS